ncbi:hypothetical protein SCARD494_01868 [Seiridium cardinale]
MVSLRPHCHHPYSSPDHAAAAYHTITAQALRLDVFIPGRDEVTTYSDIASLAIKVQRLRAIHPMSSSRDQFAFAPSVVLSLSPQLTKGIGHAGSAALLSGSFVVIWKV